MSKGTKERAAARRIVEQQKARERRRAVTLWTTRTPSRGRIPLLPSAMHILLQGSYDEVATLVYVLTHDDLRPVGVAVL